MSEEPSSTDIQEQQVPEASRRPRWGIITLIGVILVVIGAALVYLFYQPMYEASAWIQIEDTRPYIAFPDSGSSKGFVDTQVQLICSPLVLGPVLSQPEIARIPELQEEEDPLRWLGEQLTVTQVGRSELFTISYTGPNPEDSARVVNTVVDEYFNLRGRAEAERMQRVIELLEEERGRRAEEVSRLRENVRALAKQATGKDPFAVQRETEVVDPPLADLQARLANTELDRRILEARIKAFEERVSDQKVEVPQETIEQAVSEHAEVQRLRKTLWAKRSQLYEIESKLVDGEKDPSYDELRREVSRYEAILEKVRSELRQELKVELERAQMNRQRDEVADMRTRLAGYQLMEQLLQERYHEQLKSVMQVSGETIELEFASGELARAKEVYDRIANRIMKLRTEQRAPARVTQQLQATVPIKPVASPYRTMAAVSIGGFCLPFVLMGLWIGFARLKAWRKTP